jgi:hypothetical protein
MPQRNSLKRSHHNIKRILEAAFEDLFQLSPRGLTLDVASLEAKGSPIYAIHAAATLYFLPVGSPFCCQEPGCHIPLFIPERQRRLDERIASDLELTQEVNVKMEGIRCVAIRDVVFEYSQPSFPSGNVDARDGMGRTALIRAAQRGYDDLFTQLMEAGADIHLRDHKGKTAFDYLGPNHWLLKLYPLTQPDKQV